MSQIAEVYVAPDSAVASIREAAVPQKAGWFGKPKDTFWQTLRAHAGQGRLNSEWPGDAFTVLFHYLRDRKQFDIQESENSELATFLAKARGSYFLTFTPQQAQELARKLAASPFEPGDLTEYVIEFCGPEEHETMVAAVIGAAAILPGALEGIEDGAIGLMTIG